jgi:aryl-alcohol dehydrogenase-like predicted oxidoreductase
VSAPGPLPRRPLGRTGLEVSLLGLGTVKLGRNTDVKYPKAFALPDDRSAAALLEQARDLGINLIDTAPAYGSSESRLGKLLRAQREHWVLCTKTGEEYDPVHGSRFDFSPEHTRRSVERSLTRLRTDHLDVVLVHSDGNDETILRGGTLEALSDLKAEGKVRATGFSGKTVAGGLAALASCDVVMLSLSATAQAEVEVAAAAGRRGVGVLVKKALGSGHLAAAAGDPSTGLPWVAAQAGVCSIVIGTLNPTHLRANCAAVTATVTAEPGV